MANRRSAGAIIEHRPNADVGTDECDGVGSALFARRAKSAGKLLGMSHPAPLNEALDQMSLITKYMSRMADAQRKLHLSLGAWARQSRNAAFTDVGQHHADIEKMHASMVSGCATSYRLAIEELKKINDAEKEIKATEQELASLMARKAKILKCLDRPITLLRRRSEGDTLRLQQQLAEVNREMAEKEMKLADERKEMEVIKMFRYRNGMHALAEAYDKYTRVANVMYGCHHEVTEMVPAICTQDVMTLNYDGAPITRNLMHRLKRELEVLNTPSLSTQSSQLLGPSRRRSEPSRQHRGHTRGTSSFTPPPPYTPTAPTMSDLPQPGSGSGSMSSSGHSSCSLSSGSGGDTVALTVTPTTATVTVRSAQRSSPPRFANHRMYPKLPPNPYRTQLHG